MCGTGGNDILCQWKGCFSDSGLGEPTEKGNMHVLAKHVADGDPLSYYLSLDKGGEVVVDLGRVAVIDCLGVYVPGMMTILFLRVIFMSCSVMPVLKDGRVWENSG